VVTTHVLLVDDEIPLLENLATFLGAFGDRYSVTTARSGSEAIEILNRDPGIAAVVTDVRMPGIDGIELVRWCFRQDRFLKIVVMTAYGTRAVREVVLRNGAIRFLEKPIDLDVFERTLRSLAEEPPLEESMISGLELVDVVRFVNATGASRVLAFRCNGNSGLIGFASGRLIHCSTDALAGREAFFEMMLWGDGQFSVINEVDPLQQSHNIEVPTSSLIEEANRFHRAMSSH
jgi:CheY-like chemotaxis protein